MPTFKLGINTCFAVKRWAEPDEWAQIVADDLGLDVVQISLDQVDVATDTDVVLSQADAIKASCGRHGLTIDSTFTGLGAYSTNMLLDPREDVRRSWEDWFVRVIGFTGAIDAPVTGGHVGAFSVGDWRDESRRRVGWTRLKLALDRLAACARLQGLTGFYIEAMACEREPSTMEEIDALLTAGDPEHVPIQLCLDLGHQCAAGGSARDHDPYAWLQAYAASVGVIHLQQSDEHGDHHWPFTDEHNATGRIDAERVLDALALAGDRTVTMLFEVIPPFEQDDELVLEELRASVRYWKAALDAL